MRQHCSRRILIPMVLFCTLLLLSGISILHETLIPAIAQGATTTPDSIVQTGRWPRAMAYDYDKVLWITNTLDDSVVRVDIATNRQLGDPISVRTNLPGTAPSLLPSAIAFDPINKHMWVANFGGGTITVIDSQKGQVIPNTNITGLKGPIAIKYAVGLMWILTQNDDRLTRFNPNSYESLGTMVVRSADGSGSFPTTMEYNDRTGTMWVALSNEDKINIIDIKTLKSVSFIPVGDFPIGLAFDGMDMWVAHYDFTVWQLNGLTGELKAKLPLTLPAPDAPSAQRSVNVAAGGGHLWVVSGQDGMATDWAASSPVGEGPVGEYTGTAMVAGDYLFVASWLQNTVWRFKMDEPMLTPTPTNTPPATNMPSPPPSLPCTGVIPPRLVIGQQGFVTPDDPTPVRVHTGPGINDPVVGRLLKNETFTVEDGPLCDPPYVWWHVKADSANLEGWITESDKSQSKYLVAPSAR